MVQNLASLDRILGSASSAINKEKPHIAALGQLQSHRGSTISISGSQSPKVSAFHGDLPIHWSI